jgi:FlaA1/EpsC-like NDP-sugar epimerase
MTSQCPISPSDAELEAALGLRTFSANEAAVAELLTNKVVMVTGAGGSIGKALTRRIASFTPKLIVGLDQAESALFDLEDCLKADFPNVNYRSSLCDIRNQRRLVRAFASHQPEVVFHAAAYKHVPLLEAHAIEAVENNVLGTSNVIEFALAHGCKRFTLISTDKAVAPINVLGATKRLGEIICLTRARTHSECKINAVRFGNVLNSNGSVTSVFARQIAQGGPITVTHLGMQRYFLGTSSAVDFVLEASTLDLSGQVFELDLGDPIEIIDLAQRMVELAGLRFGVDIQVRHVGQRPGERLQEAQSRCVAVEGAPMIGRSVQKSGGEQETSQIIAHLKMLSESEDVNGLTHYLRRALDDWDVSQMFRSM